MEAARDTLMQMLLPQPQADLGQFLRTLLSREALQQPFAKSYEPEPMPLAEPPNVEPATMPEVPNPMDRKMPGEDDAVPFNLPELVYNRIGFPEAVNPRTFVSRLSQAYPPSELPKIDPAQEIVDREIDNPEGD
jgi:hypothetical protein